MKKCNDCNIEMRKGKLFGEPFSINMENDVDKFFVKVETGKTVNTILGTRPETIKLPLAAIICPNCGKVELYCDINKLK